MLLGLAFALAVLPGAACHNIQADRILGRDLALAIPALAQLPPDAFLSYSPVPGQRRTFLPGELNRIAKQAGLSGEFTRSECFAWPTATLDRTNLLAALRAALTGTNIELELIDFIQNSLPPGELKFERSGLNPGADSAAVWRGVLTYAPNRTLSVWARVRITVDEQDVVANAALKPGEPIAIGQLRCEHYHGPLRRETIFHDPQQLAGLTPKVAIAPGTPLSPRLVREIADVERGDTVQVVVQTAATRVQIDGVAEEGGSRGSFVTVRNLKSGRKFRARVEERGKVSVLPSNTIGLTGEDSKS